jgi:hypothetical protein
MNHEKAFSGFRIVEWALHQNRDEMLNKILIEEMTSTDFREALNRTDTIIVPAGSTEVPGSHGPLGADASPGDIYASIRLIQPQRPKQPNNSSNLSNVTPWRLP